MFINLYNEVILELLALGLRKGQFLIALHFWVETKFETAAFGS